ncbi:ORFL166C.iORF2 [Human betaherpesvirus 5]|nr:ORFL166C.iORF2 [Human betaherpesvirus 5]QHX40501.1 ORFL166C.iORF2 [Human betaherpesvirus 5]
MTTTISITGTSATQRKTKTGKRIKITSRITAFSKKQRPPLTRHPLTAAARANWGCASSRRSPPAPSPYTPAFYAPWRRCSITPSVSTPNCTRCWTPSRIPRAA